MKNKTILTFLCITLLFASSCKKENTQTAFDRPATPQNPVQTQNIDTALLANTWWKVNDQTEHCYFNSNGDHYYIKGYLPADTTVKSTWNWVNGTNIFIGSGGVHQGNCLIQKLTVDTLLMLVNTTGNFPLSYIWIRQ